MRFATEATFGCSVLKSELAFDSYSLLKNLSLSCFVRPSCKRKGKSLPFCPAKDCHSCKSTVIPAKDCHSRERLSFPRKRESSLVRRDKCFLFGVFHLVLLRHFDFLLSMRDLVNPQELNDHDNVFESKFSILHIASD